MTIPENTNRNRDQFIVRKIQSSYCMQSQWLVLGAEPQLRIESDSTVHHPLVPDRAECGCLVPIDHDCSAGHHAAQGTAAGPSSGPFHSLQAFYG